ncbi:MAG: hypothetical protein R2873_35825 [Caldilineaceae bacterium]
MKILILGAGGHAQVVADIVLQMQKHDPTMRLLGFVDDSPVLANI